VARFTTRFLGVFQFACVFSSASGLLAPTDHCAFLPCLFTFYCFQRPPLSSASFVFCCVVLGRDSLQFFWWYCLHSVYRWALDSALILSVVSTCLLLLQVSIPLRVLLGWYCFHSLPGELLSACDCVVPPSVSPFRCRFNYENYQILLSFSSRWAFDCCCYVYAPTLQNSFVSSLRRPARFSFSRSKVDYGFCISSITRLIASW